MNNKKISELPLNLAPTINDFLIGASTENPNLLQRIPIGALPFVSSESIIDPLALPEIEASEPLAFILATSALSPNQIVKVPFPINATLKIYDKDNNFLLNLDGLKINDSASFLSRQEQENAGIPNRENILILNLGEGNNGGNNGGNTGITIYQDGFLFTEDSISSLNFQGATILDYSPQTNEIMSINAYGINFFAHEDSVNQTINLLVKGGGVNTSFDTENSIGIVEVPGVEDEGSPLFLALEEIRSRLSAIESALNL